MPSVDSQKRIAVVGAGAVGCYYGGVLARGGLPVTLIGRKTHVEAVRRNGLVIERANGRETIGVAAATDVDAARGADVVLVCVKSPDTETVARDLASIVDSHTAIVSLQNGVDNAMRLRSVLSNDVYAAVVYVATMMSGPGIVRHIGRGDLVLGAASDIASLPRVRERLTDLAAMFERAGVGCPITDDIDAALWTKLAINCACNAVSALGRANYGRMRREPLVRGLMVAALREAVAVARADGVALDEQVPESALWGIVDAMNAQYSSTAQDILRGKPTEIDSLNGYIVSRGDAQGIDVPVNRTLHALVKLRETGDDLGAA
ncbi:MAG TPA: 2-dehydropantoate 2-reductase [Casimicrobiaceae bacterium]|nr:2-dehydropantoate 2-reductase [Casimicrobiaceae bacterium]